MALKWFNRKSKPAPAPDTPPSETAGGQASGPDPQTAGVSPPDAPAGSAAPPKTAAAGSRNSEKKGFFNRLRQGLSKTRAILTTDIDALFSGRTQIDDDLLEELEELLITADIGVRTATDLIAGLSKKAGGISAPDELKAALKTEIRSYLEGASPATPPAVERPHVVMVVGVNGVGKTTTIGKLAARHSAGGHKVLIAAADTFRAAAVEQLSIWAERAGADIVRHQDNADPAAVVFDSIEAAVARDCDIVLVDTAGRLHTKTNLMEELKKIRRTIAGRLPGAPHEILLVLDATTGQNAVMQAELFNEALGITAIALTKLDGTAKGGIVVSICRTLQIPLKYIGVGEQIEDLQDFEPEQYVNALF